MAKKTWTPGVGDSVKLRVGRGTYTGMVVEALTDGNVLVEYESPKLGVRRVPRRVAVLRAA